MLYAVPGDLLSKVNRYAFEAILQIITKFVAQVTQAVYELISMLSYFYFTYFFVQKYPFYFRNVPFRKNIEISQEVQMIPFHCSLYFHHLYTPNR